MSHDTAFGAVRLGYFVIESQRLDSWQRFLKDGLGLHLVSRESNTLSFRMDEHAQRLLVCKGPAEDLVAIGVELDNAATLARVLQRLGARGIATRAGGEAEAAMRGVGSFVRLTGPKGLMIELYTQPVLVSEPLQMLSSGFVTGAGGVGHIAMTTRRPEEAQRFWTEIFDARISDDIVERLAGVTLDIRFLRLNERHHSLAFATVRAPKLDPIRTRVQHFNLLAASFDDVVSAFRRCKALGFEMAHEIGQHPNDRELSFYVISPSGFEVELGCNALTVDEVEWIPVSYQGISLWGHKPPSTSLVTQMLVNLGNFSRGLRSALRREYSPL